MTTAAKTRQILILLKDGRKRIVSNIPANAKITYGPISPGRAGDYNGSLALRIYTSAQNQLAVFTDVKEFQDLTLGVEDECVTTKVESQNGTGPGQKPTRAITDPFSHCSLAPLVDLAAF